MEEEAVDDQASEDTLEDQLARFYDQEAPDRAHRDLPARRIKARSAFVEMLTAEGRQSVVEIGAGAGHDAVALMASGLKVSAIDLSSEHVALCRARSVDARVASVTRLPFLDQSFDAGWTMSTLLHLPDSRVDEALIEIIRVLRPGSPLAIGLWGGADREYVLESDRYDPPRFFAIRSDDAVTTRLARFGSIESFSTWPSLHDPEEHYQFAVLRTGPILTR